MASPAYESDFLRATHGAAGVSKQKATEWRSGLRGAEADVGLDRPLTGIPYLVLVGALSMAKEALMAPERIPELMARGLAVMSPDVETAPEPMIAILPHPADLTMTEQLQASGLSCNTDRRRKKVRQIWEGVAVVAKISAIVGPIGGVVHAALLPTIDPDEKTEAVDVAPRNESPSVSEDEALVSQAAAEAENTLDDIPDATKTSGQKMAPDRGLPDEIRSSTGAPPISSTVERRFMSPTSTAVRNRNKAGDEAIPGFLRDGEPLIAGSQAKAEQTSGETPRTT